MAKKLSNSDLVHLVRVQKTIHDFLCGCSEHDSYFRSLSLICESIEQFFVSEVYEKHSTLAFHLELQRVFDDMMSSPSYDRYKSILLKILGNKK